MRPALQRACRCLCDPVGLQERRLQDLGLRLGHDGGQGNREAGHEARGNNGGDRVGGDEFEHGV